MSNGLSVAIERSDRGYDSSGALPCVGSSIHEPSEWTLSPGGGRGGGERGTRGAT